MNFAYFGCGVVERLLYEYNGCWKEHTKIDNINDTF